MIDPENDFLRAFINWILPSAIAGAVIQIVTRAMDAKITFIGVVMSMTLAITLGCVVGAVVFLHFGDIEMIIICTSVASVLSRDISRWMVYKSKIDRPLQDAFKALIRYLFGKYGK